MGVPWAAALANNIGAPNFDPSSPCSHSGTPTLPQAARVVNLKETDCEGYRLSRDFCLQDSNTVRL